MQQKDKTCNNLENQTVDEVSISSEQYNNILNIQNKILEMVASHDDSKDILGKLCQLAETLLDNAVASIMLVDNSTGLMSVLSAPSIPQVGHDALKNLKPGPTGGSCGNAVFHNKAQYVKDTFKDDRWGDLRQVAYDFNLCSCWSMPIRDQDKNPIGSFALSSFEHRAPAPFHKKLLETAASIVNIVLKNEKSEIRNMLFSKAMESASEGILITDEQNNIIEVNKSFEKIYGLVQEDIIGKNPRILSSKKYPKKFYDEMWNSIKNDDSWSGEIINKKADGTEIVQWLSISTLHNKENDIHHYLAVFSDLTEIREKEKQLLRSEKMVSMGEMIGNIAHQWRQPLSTIATSATGMKLQKEFNNLSDEDFNNSCDFINLNAQYLSKTIDDFKNFIKGDRKKKLFNLKENVNSFLNLVQGSIKNHHIEMVIDIEDNIRIDSYENELIQCFINLFNNSKDILKENELEEKYIFISAKLENRTTIIEIKDNAGGIPQDIIGKIFEPYFTTKHQSQGTGLGLNMTYNIIVDGMGGEIEVSNQIFEYKDKEYTGAVFKIVLPI